MGRENNAALLSSLHSPAAVDFHVLSALPRRPFSSPKGKWRGWRETKALRIAREHTSISTAAAISCRSTILLHCWHCGQKASSNPLYVWGGHAHQQGSSPGRNTALASSCFLWLQAEAGELTISKQRISLWESLCCGVFGCCWFGSDLVCVIRLQKVLRCGTLIQSTLLTVVPSKGSPHPSKMQSTQQGCAWCWPGRRRFLKAANSTAGSSGTGGEMWQATSIVPAGSAGASTGSCCSVSDAPSVLWGEHFAQSIKELRGQSRSPSTASGSGQSSRSALRHYILQKCS